MRQYLKFIGWKLETTSGLQVYGLLLFLWALYFTTGFNGEMAPVLLLFVSTAAVGIDQLEFVQYVRPHARMLNRRASVFWGCVGMIVFIFGACITPESVYERYPNIDNVFHFSGGVVLVMFLKHSLTDKYGFSLRPQKILIYAICVMIAWEAYEAFMEMYFGIPWTGLLDGVKDILVGAAGGGLMLQRQSEKDRY